MPVYKKLPDAELEVMLAIWHSDTPTHVGEIQKMIGRDRPHQALQVLLGRLSEKGFVRCEKIGRLNYYTPLVEEQVYCSRETDSLIDKLYGSSPARLVAALVEENRLSEHDLNALRDMLQGRS